MPLTASKQRMTKDSQNSPSASPKPEKLHTDLTVGEILRRTRLHYNIKYDQIERDLRIKAEHIEALEYNLVDRLPGRVYVFGFVRTYSEYLGLDGEKMVALLKKQAGRKVEKIKPVLTLPQEDEEQSSPGGYVIAGSAIVLLASLLIFSGLTSQNAPEEIPPVPKELSAQLTAPQKPEPAKPPALETSEQATQPAATAEKPTAPHPLILKATENTWLEIKGSDRKVVFSRVLNKDEEYWVPVDQTDLSMTLGNAGGLLIVLEGQTLPLLGKTGQVKRNVSLNPEKLRSFLPKKPKS